ncbi:hypothetical protein [Bradyrhizobium sp. cf659]|uniref:hypothetical protein n=1 Tax=Bradyrhizobium sp. cf659 TaxID=1761771 RepID=UPI0015A6B836|nr:hypothetical protein [Bradyrhizobium sp. cf659]
MRTGFSKLTAMGFSAPSRQPYLKLKVENPKSNSAAVTEYVRQAALPYDWALKSPAFMGPRSAQKVQDDVRGNRARGAGLFVLILFL